MPKALPPATRAKARRLRKEDKSLSEIRDELGISYGSAQRFTRDVRPEKERPRAVRAKIAAAKRGPHEEWKATVPRGGCGTPGCQRADCPIEPGECHCACGEQAPLAGDDDRTRNYVRGEPRLYVKGHQRSGNTLMAAEGGERLLSALQRVDMTRIEASRRAKLGKGVVGDLVGIKGYRLRRERCERIVDVLRAAHEAEELDVSDLALERLFTEERPTDEVPGERARRVDRQRPALPRSECGDGRHFKADVARARSEAEADGVWLQEQAIASLHLPRPTFINMEKRGRIESEARLVGAVRVRRYDPREVKRLGRELLTSEAAWDRRRRDPFSVYASAIAHGASHDDARRRADLAVERVRELGRIRFGTGAGRPKSAPGYHAEWATKFAILKTEMDEHYAVFHLAGELPPSNLGVALLVAEDDFGEHPSRWRYDPHDRPENASRRVWKAIKPLV